MDTDTDDDGLTDWEEVSGCISNGATPPVCTATTFSVTDPTDVDSDDDGLTDWEEVSGCISNGATPPVCTATTFSATDAMNPDTDGGGALDGAEVKYDNTDPVNDDTDDVLDSDGDGISNDDETNIYSTDPFDQDTDNDGLKDGQEVMTYNTDPLNPDTDNGGLNDGEEIARGMNPLLMSDDANPILPNNNTGRSRGSVRSVADTPSLAFAKVDMDCGYQNLPNWEEKDTIKTYIAREGSVAGKVIKIDRGKGYYKYCAGGLNMAEIVQNKPSSRAGFRGFVSERSGSMNNMYNMAGRDMDLYEGIYLNSADGGTESYRDTLQNRRNYVDSIQGQNQAEPMVNSAPTRTGTKAYRGSAGKGLTTTQMHRLRKLREQLSKDEYTNMIKLEAQRIAELESAYDPSQEGA